MSTLSTLLRHIPNRYTKKYLYFKVPQEKRDCFYGKIWQARLKAWHRKGERSSPLLADSQHEGAELIQVMGVVIGVHADPPEAGGITRQYLLTKYQSKLSYHICPLHFFTDINNLSTG